MTDRSEEPVTEPNPLPTRQQIADAIEEWDEDTAGTYLRQADAVLALLVSTPRPEPYPGGIGGTVLVRLDFEDAHRWVNNAYEPHRDRANRLREACRVALGLVPGVAADRVSTPQPEPARLWVRGDLFTIVDIDDRPDVTAGTVYRVTVGEENGDRAVCFIDDRGDEQAIHVSAITAGGAAAEEAPPEPAGYAVGDWFTIDPSIIDDGDDGLTVGKAYQITTVDPQRFGMVADDGEPCGIARFYTIPCPPPAAAPPEPARPAWVKIVSAKRISSSFTYGDVLPVAAWAIDEDGRDGPGIDLGDGFCWLEPDWWVPADPPSAPVAAPVDEPEPAPKFTVGDRVEVVETMGAKWIAVGQVLPVVSAPAGCPQPKDDEVCVPTAHGPCCYPVGCFRAAAPAPSPDPPPSSFDRQDIEDAIYDALSHLCLNDDDLARAAGDVYRALAGAGSPEPGDDGTEAADEVAVLLTRSDVEFGAGPEPKLGFARRVRFGVACTEALGRAGHE